jgi:hypothetical protein
MTPVKALQAALAAEHAAVYVTGFLGARLPSPTSRRSMPTCSRRTRSTAGIGTN